MCYCVDLILTHPLLYVFLSGPKYMANPVASAMSKWCCQSALLQPSSQASTWKRKRKGCIPYQIRKLDSNKMPSSSAMTVVEFHSEADKIQKIFASKWTSSKDLLISCKTVWLRAFKKRLYLVFSNNFQGLKSTLFSWNLFSFLNIELGEQLLLIRLSISFNSKYGLFSKNVSNFWWLSIKQSYKVSKNPLRMFFWM